MKEKAVALGFKAFQFATGTVDQFLDGLEKNPSPVKKYFPRLSTLIFLRRHRGGLHTGSLSTILDQPLDKTDAIVKDLLTGEFPVEQTGNVIKLTNKKKS